MKKKLICEKCGCSDDSVEEGFCPYSRDIHDEEVPRTLCAKCYQESCNDI